VEKVDRRDGLCSGLEASLRALTLQGLTSSPTHVRRDEVELLEDDDVDDVEHELGDDDDQLLFCASDDDAQHVRQYLASLPKTRACSAGTCRDSVMPPVFHRGLSSPDEAEEDLLQATASAAASSAPSTSAATPAAAEAGGGVRNKRGSTGSQSQASSSGRGSQQGKRGSVPLQGGKIKTPTTPMSWMVLRSPLARIESFHSDDFDYWNSSDDAERSSVTSPSPMSATTPTVPCFAYKLHLAGRKKPPKVRKASTADNGGGKTGKKSDKHKGTSPS
jgi:hypothetical protein